MNSGIYCIENKTDTKKYIGQAQDIGRRYKRHMRELRKNKSNNKHLQRAWNKYGEENFIFYIIEECDIESLDKKEIYYIKKLKSHSSENGYNISWGGNAPMRGVFVTDEHRKHLSESLSGDKNPMYGKKTPMAVLKKIAAALLGRVQSETEKLNNSYGQVGKKKRKGTSKYIGESITENGSFMARIQNIYTKERIYLGCFEVEKDAAKAFDEKSWEIYKDIYIN